MTQVSHVCEISIIKTCLTLKCIIGMFAKEIFSIGWSAYVYPLSSKHMANESGALLSSWGDPVVGPGRAWAFLLVSTCAADQTLGARESQCQLKGKCSASLLNTVIKSGINWKACLRYFFCFRYGKCQVQSILIKLTRIYAVVFDHENYMQKSWDVSLLKMLLATFSLQIADRVLHNNLVLSAYKFYLFICVTSFSFRCQKNRLDW